MPSSISRSAITNKLMEQLLTFGFPVGDNSSPDKPYGWQGEPNDVNSTFIPWSVLTPGTASPQVTQSMGDTGMNWRLNYSVFFAGLSRKQSEVFSDKIRTQLTNIIRETVMSATGSWKIQKVTCIAIGSNTRVGSAWPDYYTQSDSYEVWVTKG